MPYNESTEMYLETLYILQQEHGHAHVADVANRLNITMPSVSKAMNRLRELKLINKQAYGAITLTKEGETISKRINRKHNMIADYLVKSLKLSREDALENACKIEHVISDSAMNAIMHFLESEVG
ncbi:MAG: metal-dependent transcriptional regulator [Eubacteriales bacterium]|jgi:Mn-dependent DtxR family transcriptional regulator|nr:metal-dependent transcriptional regulator [Eubacteriales bacterium]MDD4716904.1 metal-dependent transcriptional regulator [Eubacteriales bacterium]